MTPSRVVFDASLIVRAAVDRSESALGWIRRAEEGEIEAVVPDLLFAECAHALLRYLRGGAIDGRIALERIEWVASLRLEARPLRTLVGAGLATAVDRKLSDYDGCYLALAEAEQAVLVTADRRLAAAARNVELVA